MNKTRPKQLSFRVSEEEYQQLLYNADMGRIRKIGSAHCNYSQILYQFLTFTQNLKRSLSLQLQIITYFLIAISYMIYY